MSQYKTTITQEMPGAAITYHKLGGLKEQKSIAFWDPEVQIQDVNMLLLKRVKKDPSSPLPSFWWPLLTVFGIPWLVATAPQSLLPLFHGILLSHSYKDTSC